MKKTREEHFVEFFLVGKCLNKDKYIPHICSKGKALPGYATAIIWWYQRWDFNITTVRFVVGQQRRSRQKTGALEQATQEESKLGSNVGNQAEDERTATRATRSSNVSTRRQTEQ